MINEFKEIGKESLVYEQASEHEFNELQAQNMELKRRIIELKYMLLLREQKTEFIMDEFCMLAEMIRDDRLRKRMRRILETLERRNSRLNCRQDMVLRSFFNDVYLEKIDAYMPYRSVERRRLYDEYF